MKKIYIIRHAESVANIGGRTERNDTVPLSEKGKEQAVKLVEEIKIVPDLIVVSSYSRTQETASPFIKKHSTVPVEIWDIHEFTYLNTEINNGTTKAERMPAIKKYWESLNIHHRDGGKAESFHDFFKRIQLFLEKLDKREEKNIVIFSHGFFIYGLLKYLSESNEDINEINLVQKFMCDCKEIMMAGEKIPIDNASIHEIILD